MEFLKKNLALVLAFLLPIVLIVVVALFAYLPSLFFSPRYNFVYAVCDEGSGNYYSGYGCQKYLTQKYVIEKNKLVVRADEEIDVTENFLNDFTGDGIIDEKDKRRIAYATHIFLYDPKKNESREIAIEEAEMLKLSGLLTSPDGVAVSGDQSYTSDGDFFFLFGSTHSSYGYYLMKGNSRKKVNLVGDDERYSYQKNFRFIGWVLTELPE